MHDARDIGEREAAHLARDIGPDVIALDEVSISQCDVVIIPGDDVASRWCRTTDGGEIRINNARLIAQSRGPRDVGPNEVALDEVVVVGGT